MTGDSGIVTGDSGQGPKSVTMDQNDRSRWTGINGHVRPEWLVTLGRNTHLGGELYSPAKLKQLEGYLSRRGIELKVGDAFLPFGKAGGFDATNGKMVLRDNPTKYEVWHEVSHFRQYQQLGKERYLALPRSMEYNAPEQFVFDLLENSTKRWRTLNFEEQQHAISYIEYIGGFR